MESDSSRVTLNLVAPYVTEDCRDPIDAARHADIVRKLMALCGRSEDATCVARNMRRITAACDAVHAEYIMETQNIDEAELRAKYNTTRMSAFFRFKGRVDRLASMLTGLGVPKRDARARAFSQLSDAWSISIDRLKERYVQSAAAIELVRTFRRDDADDVVCTVRFSNSDSTLVVERQHHDVLVSEMAEGVVDSYLTTFYTVSDLPRFAHKLFSNRYNVSTVRGVVDSSEYTHRRRRE